MSLMLKFRGHFFIWQKFKEYEDYLMIIKNILKGIIIGIGSIAPGVSGGTFAMMLGVYDKITDAIGNFYIDFKSKFMFLCSIGLGIGFSRILEYLFVSYEFASKFVFVGIMIGSIPSIYNEAKKKGFRRYYLLPMVLTLLLTIGLAILDNSNVNVDKITSLSFKDSVFYGGVISLGTIIPGISSSVLLMYAGVYSIILDAIGSIKIDILLPLGLGFVFVTLILSKCINFMFKRYYGWTYFMVLGFVLGSITTLIPRVASFKDLIIGLVLISISTVLSYTFSQKLLNNENSKK